MSDDAMQALLDKLSKQPHLDDVVEEVAALINWYRTLPGNGSGGSLHVVVEDDNCDDSHVQFCYGYASGAGDRIGADLASILSRMDAYDRVHAVDQANS